LAKACNPRVYLRPTYPWYLGNDRKTQFRDNIRTMALGFNAVSNFPDEYNGGDPLAARNPEQVREHVRQMIRGIAGDPEALAWFRDPEHMLYCSEFAHLSFSAGLIVPLNETAITELAGAKWWKKFAAQVTAHNAGRPSAFTQLNENPNADLVPLALAPADLKPAAAYAPIGDKDASLLAFRPMTMADIIESFMALHFPRDAMGESLAQVQASVFRQLRPGLLELMALSELPPSDPNAGPLKISSTGSAPSSSRNIPITPVSALPWPLFLRKLAACPDHAETAEPGSSSPHLDASRRNGTPRGWPSRPRLRGSRTPLVDPQLR